MRETKKPQSAYAEQPMDTALAFDAERLRTRLDSMLQQRLQLERSGQKIQAIQLGRKIAQMRCQLIKQLTPRR